MQNSRLIVAQLVKAMTRRAAQAYKTYKLGGMLSEMLYSPATYGVDFGGGGRDKLPRPKVSTYTN